MNKCPACGQRIPQIQYARYMALGTWRKRTHSEPGYIHHDSLYYRGFHAIKELQPVDGKWKWVRVIAEDGLEIIVGPTTWVYEKWGNLP